MENKERAEQAFNLVFSVMPEKKSMCAQYVYQLGKSYITLEQPKKNDNGHGNCGSQEYYDSLMRIGYEKQMDTKISKTALIESITSGDFPCGTILAYQAIDKPQDPNNVPNAYKYGHTQFYLGDRRWVTSVKDNYGCEFVYNSIPSKNWDYKIFFPPIV